MPRTCHFCHFLNSYVCDEEFTVCVGCGRCGRNQKQEEKK